MEEKSGSRPIPTYIHFIMNRLAPIVRWLFKHPVLSLAGLVGVIALIMIGGAMLSGSPEPESGGKTVAGSTGASGETSGEDGSGVWSDFKSSGSDGNIAGAPNASGQEQIKTPGVEEETIEEGRVKPKPDPFDSNTAQRAEVERQLNEQPAVQALPLNQSGVFADISNVLPDDRLVITALYSGSRARAEAVWAAFPFEM